MKLNRQHPEGTGDNVKSIMDREREQWKEDWSKLSIEEKQRHAKYLSDLYDFKNNPQFFGKKEMEEILKNADCDICIMPNEFHEEYSLEEYE